MWYNEAVVYQIYPLVFAAHRCKTTEMRPRQNSTGCCGYWTG